MSKIQNLNIELDKLYLNLSHIEAKFDHIDFNRVQQLKPHVIERSINRIVKIGNDRKIRERDRVAIDKFFANISSANLIRLKGKVFGNKLIYGNAYLLSHPKKHYFDTSQNIEDFFITRDKIYRDNIRKQKLQSELDDINRIGYGGFLSSKPSKREFDHKIYKIKNELIEVTHNVSQSFIRDEEFLLSLCKISHEHYDEVRKIDAKISSIKSQITELRKQETYSLKMAKAAAFDDEARQQAKGFKSKIEKQDKCPYCSKMIAINSHLDHIHPLSKGGLNVAENLVDCCADCNLKKSDKGVFQFCKEQGFNYEDVCNRLLKMGKHI